MSDEYGMTEQEIIGRLRALGSHHTPALLATDQKAIWREVCREAADFIENTQGVLAAWKRDYDGEKARGDAWMADCKAAEQKLLSYVNSDSTRYGWLKENAVGVTITTKTQMFSISGGDLDRVLDVAIKYSQSDIRDER